MTRLRLQVARHQVRLVAASVGPRISPPLYLVVPTAKLSCSVVPGERRVSRAVQHHLAKGASSHLCRASTVSKTRFAETNADERCIDGALTTPKSRIGHSEHYIPYRS